MNARILVLVGLLTAGLVLLFWFMAPKESPGSQDELTPEPALPEAQAPGEGTVDLVEAPLVSNAPESGPPEVRRVVPAETDETPLRTWPQEETRWLDIRLIVPAETPRDEQSWVVALDANADYAQVYGEDGPLVGLFAGREPLRIDGVLGALPVSPSGEARIPLPPDAEEVWLAVGGSYLYSLEPHRVDVHAAAEPVELRPVLGAWISGRLLAPPGTPETDLEAVEVRLRWSINASLQLGTAGSDDLDLGAKVDATGRFELRAVPVGKPQTLVTDSLSLAVTISEDLVALPGEHVEVEVAMLIGGSVRGRVVDQEGEPVAAAAVHALGNEFLGNPTARLRETESDAAGLFMLESVTPGRVTVRVRHDDFQELRCPSFALADGEARDHGDIVLDQGLAIAGTVIFPDGAPATGTRVRIEPDLSQNISGDNVDPADYAGRDNDDTVDDEGVFRIAGLGPGPWVVSAQLRIEEEQEGGPAAGRWAAGQDVVRAPHQELNLVLVPPVHVSGEVVDGVGEPVTDFVIRGERAGSQWYMPPSEEREEAFESEDGRFRLTDLRSGDWTFTAEAEGYATSAELDLELPSDEQLALVLYRPVRLAGEVVDPDGRPVAGAEVSKELEGVEVFVAMQGRGDWPVARSDGEGRFTLDDLAPGAGSVVAKKDGFAPSAAVAFELDEGEQRVDLVLTMRRGGTISGEVYGSDGEPAAGCMLILQMPTLQERRFTNADSDGTFVERGLTPGTWQVQAFPGIESLQSESGESVDRAKLLGALKMKTVELVDEAEEHVVLGEPPADPVRVYGRITLADAAVQDTIISFVPTEGGGMELLKIKPVDADGRYEVQLDEPGDYLVTIQTVGTPGRTNSIEFRRKIPGGEEFELDFEMPLGRVSGRVRGPDGEPVVDARVTLNTDGGLVFGTVFGGQYNETATNADGDYDIAYLRPGRYAVAAGGMFLGGLLGDDEGLGREVTIVDVAEGQWVRGLDFRLEEPGTIFGTVRDPGGALVEGASIFVRDGEGQLVELFSIAQTNASGSFEYPGLAPGDYTITARSSTLASGGGTPVRVRSGERTEVTVAMAPGTVLLVTVIDRSGSDVPSRVSVLDAEGREMNGMLGLKEIMERYNGGLTSAMQRVGPLPPGSYNVHAVAEDGRSAKRPVTLDGRPERKVKLRLR